jgi:hypothetical protein
MFVRNTMSAGWDTKRVLRHLGFYLTCEAGKVALGLGDNSVGDLLPEYFAQAGLIEIDTFFLSDKASPLQPPYGSAEQQALVDALCTDVVEGRWVWNAEEARRYFLAGGGNSGAFDSAWRELLADQRSEHDAIRGKTLSTGGGNLMYLAVGRSP